MLHPIIKRVFTSLAVLVMLVSILLNTSPVFASGGTAEHTVRRGENLTQIAKKYGLTVEKIMAANPKIKDPNVLLIGQVLVLPAGRSEGVSAAQNQGRYIRWQMERNGATISGDERFYLVKNNDSLTKIANSYGITLEKLLDANPQIDDANRLFRDELVRIPEGIGEKAPSYYATPPSGTSR